MLGEKSIEKFEYKPLEFDYESVYGKMYGIIDRLNELNNKLQYLNKHLLVYV